MPGELEPASNWLDYYRRFWEESFDRLDDYLHKIKAQRKKSSPKRRAMPATSPQALAPLPRPLATASAAHRDERWAMGSVDHPNMVYLGKNMLLFRNQSATQLAD
jgi:hypothetical protein